jgi:hypothetical protein
MAGYIIDVAIVTVLSVGLVAIMGVMLNGIGEKVFARNKRNEFVDQSARFQVGWNSVGGNWSSVGSQWKSKGSKHK